MFLQKVNQRPQWFGLGLDGVGQVGAIETGYECLWVNQTKLIDDVFPHLLGGGGGESDDRNAGEALTEGFEVTVIRSEIVAPFGDAMGLVDGD